VTRDAQRSRVYDWENRTIGPLDRTLIPFVQAQGMVNAIWADMGLAFPPKVEKLPGRSTAVIADATRLRLRLPEHLPSWVLLHELAHAMTSTHDGSSDRHGPVFMGVYLTLLARYMRLPRERLLPSLQAAGIAVDLKAVPVFIDS